MLHFKLLPYVEKHQCTMNGVQLVFREELMEYIRRIRIYHSADMKILSCYVNECAVFYV